MHAPRLSIDRSPKHGTDSAASSDGFVNVKQKDHCGETSCTVRSTMILRPSTRTTTTGSPA